MYWVRNIIELLEGAAESESESGYGLLEMVAATAPCVRVSCVRVSCVRVSCVRVSCVRVSCVRVSVCPSALLSF